MLTSSLELHSGSLFLDLSGNLHFFEHTKDESFCSFVNVISGNSLSIAVEEVDFEYYRPIGELDKNALMDIIRRLSKVCTENIYEKSFLKKQLANLS